MRIAARSALKRCLIRYLGLGWSGYVPADCRNTLVLVPANYAWILWGWPNRLLARVRAVGSEVFVLGPMAAGDFTSGIDTEAELRLLPAGYSGGIWTNRIDVIAPMVLRR
jgi:glycerophosphoryl diester phosphodiesterase